MGCDIHAVFQRRNGDKWEDVSSEWDQRRDDVLFGWLADVQNRYDMEPISAPRGLPSDWPQDAAMGDHSHSWLTSEEILSAEPSPMPHENVDYFLQEVRRLHELYGGVRLVFGFDSRQTDGMAMRPEPQDFGVPPEHADAAAQYGHWLVEECARLCDSMTLFTGFDCAQAIRAKYGVR